MKLSLLLAIALSVTLFPLVAYSQETTGNVQGYAVDEAGNPIPDLSVTVTGQSLPGAVQAQTTSDGYFEIRDLPVGTYSLRLSHVAFRNIDLEQVAVALGRTTNLGRIQMGSVTYEMPALVVTAKRLLIDPQSTATGSDITSEEFQDLPLDRNYQNITTLLPHANESFLGDQVNFAGGTGQENKYFIDGVEATDPYLGLTGTNLPYNFVEDVVVRTGGYEAEYRSSLGGIVDIVSRSGGNDIHGQAFGFFVNNQFAGDSRVAVVDPRTGDFAQYDAGLSVGGPIQRDKLWFLAAYNAQVTSEDVEIPGVGVYEDKGTAHIFAGKLDWKPTDATDLSLTVTGDPSTRDAVGEMFGEAGAPVSFENPDPFLVDLTTGGINVLTRGTHRFSSGMFLEASLSGITRTLKYQGATERGRSEETFINDETGVWSGGYLTPTDDKSVELTADVKMTLPLGKHLLKTGAAYRDNRLDFNEEFNALFRESDSLYTDFRFSALDGTVRNRIPSVFVQDSWRVTERLRLNAGLRWDGQFLLGTNGKVAQKITDQYQPRLGFVYQPGELGTQKIFGSFGRYYQEMALALSVVKHNENILFQITDYDHDPRVDPSGGSSFSEPGATQSEVKGLKGQYFDEFNLGYERQLGDRLTLGARGIYRTLREGIDDGYVESLDEFVYGNPGSGLLSEYPKMKRDYTALELTAQLFGGERYSARCSYVLSRTYGNYTGLYDSDNGIVFSNIGGQFDLLEQVSTGLLPNDRTHVFKLSGSYRLTGGLTGGAVFTWETGTPLSLFEPSSVIIWPKPAEKRGTAGRTPSIWDLNLRFVYDLDTVVPSPLQPRFVLDVFHVASQRKAVAYNERVVSDASETPFQATRYQPPMAVRLGMEVGF